MACKKCCAGEVSVFWVLLCACELAADKSPRATAIEVVWSGHDELADFWMPCLPGPQYLGQPKLARLLRCFDETDALHCKTKCPICADRICHVTCGANAWADMLQAQQPQKREGGVIKVCYLFACTPEATVRARGISGASWPRR